MNSFINHNIENLIYSKLDLNELYDIGKAFENNKKFISHFYDKLEHTWCLKMKEYNNLLLFYGENYDEIIWKFFLDYSVWSYNENCRDIYIYNLIWNLRIKEGSPTYIKDLNDKQLQMIKNIKWESTSNVRFSYTNKCIIYIQNNNNITFIHYEVKSKIIKDIKEKLIGKEVFIWKLVTDKRLMDRVSSHNQINLTLSHNLFKKNYEKLKNLWYYELKGKVFKNKYDRYHTLVGGKYESKGKFMYGRNFEEILWKIFKFEKTCFYIYKDIERYSSKEYKRKMNNKDKIIINHGFENWDWKQVKNKSHDSYDYIIFNVDMNPLDTHYYILNNFSKKYIIEKMRILCADSLYTKNCFGHLKKKI